MPEEVNIRTEEMNCPNCELEALDEAKEEDEEDYFCYNCGELFTEDEVEGLK